MRFILILVLFFPMSGCMSAQQIAAYRAQTDNGDDAACRSYGAKPGTDVYVQCRMQRQQSRDAAESARQAALLAEPTNPIPQSDAPVLHNILPQTRRCQSVPAGMGTWQTVCN